MENLARISSKQPIEAQKIWLEMLKADSPYPDYPEKSIRTLLKNLLTFGPEGERKALDVIDAYLKRGIENPSIWWTEIKNQPIEIR